MVQGGYRHYLMPWIWQQKVKEDNEGGKGKPLRLFDAAKSIMRNTQNMAVNTSVGKQVLNLKNKSDRFNKCSTLIMISI